MDVSEIGVYMVVVSTAIAIASCICIMLIALAKITISDCKKRDYRNIAFGLFLWCAIIGMGLVCVGEWFNI